MCAAARIFRAAAPYLYVFYVIFYAVRFICCMRGYLSSAFRTAEAIAAAKYLSSLAKSTSP